MVIPPKRISWHWIWMEIEARVGWCKVDTMVISRCSWWNSRSVKILVTNSFRCHSKSEWSEFGFNEATRRQGERSADLCLAQDNYIQSRSTAIESIESTIAELGSIFSQLAGMVAEQRETVQRIDADTTDIAA